MEIDWRSALTYVQRDPLWKRRVAVGGTLMLLAPPAGWLLALGYRSVVGQRLVEGDAPLLPSWRRNLTAFLGRGAASSGVILSYLTPFVIAYWSLGVRTPDVMVQQWRQVVTFVMGVVMFPPLALPTLPALYAVRYDWLDFSMAEILTLAVLFFGPIVLLPAAFLQVARRRSFGAAFDVVSAVRLVATSPRLYGEAWLLSLCISALAVALVPFTPWLLFWSYLVISHLFLQVLTAHAIRSDAMRLAARRIAA